MKVWSGYGSEHSMNLVMVGKFKSASGAEEAQQLIEDLRDRLGEKISVGSETGRYSDGVRDVLHGLSFSMVSPSELEQLCCEFYLEVEQDKLILTTDEIDISLFLKAMIQKGGKVEIYSAHDYEDEPYGRGK
ncbi:MAG: hypothetical protein D8M28_00625 [Proteobacteria bacterium]|nr:hypothetical protein [Pseudomonadota bacterium]